MVPTASQFMLMWRPTALTSRQARCTGFARSKPLPSGRRVQGFGGAYREADRKRLAAPAHDPVVDRNFDTPARTVCARVAQVPQQHFARGIDGCRRFRNTELNGRKFRHPVIAAGNRTARDTLAGSRKIFVERARGGTHGGGSKAGGNIAQHRNREGGIAGVERAPGVSPLVVAAKLNMRCAGTNTSSSTSVLLPVPARPTTFQVSSMAYRRRRNEQKCRR